MLKIICLVCVAGFTSLRRSRAASICSIIPAALAHQPHLFGLFVAWTCWPPLLLHILGSAIVAWAWKCTVVQCSCMDMEMYSAVHCCCIVRYMQYWYCALVCCCIVMNGYIGVAWTWTVVQCSCCCHKSCIFRGFLYFVCCQPSVIGSSLIPCLLYCRCCCSIFRGLLYFVCTANLISTNVISTIAII